MCHYTSWSIATDWMASHLNTFHDAGFDAAISLVADELCTGEAQRRMSRQLATSLAPYLSVELEQLVVAAR